MCHIWLCFYDSKTMRCSSIYPGEYFVRFIKMKFNLSFQILVYGPLNIWYLFVLLYGFIFENSFQQRSARQKCYMYGHFECEKKNWEKKIRWNWSIYWFRIDSMCQWIDPFAVDNELLCSYAFVFVFASFFCMATWSQCANSHVIDIKINTQYAITLECWQINRALQLLT